MSKPAKKFCRITKYIEKTSPKFYEILEDLCVMGAFRPRRESGGVTFIWPSDETVKQLERIIFTDDDVERGVNIVFAHVIHDYLPSVIAWNTKQNDIPNGLKKKVEVAKISSSRITLADGTELELDTKFKSFAPSGNENQAVYRIVKGSLNPEAFTKPATYENSKPATGKTNAKPQHSGGTSSVVDKSKINKSMLTTLAYALTHGERVAKAPFSTLVNFYNFAVREFKEVVPLLNVIYDYRIISTTVFIFNSPHPKIQEALQLYGLTVRNDAIARAKIYGKNQYISLIDQIRSSASGGNTGNADQESFNQGGLRQILNKHKTMHAEAIKKIKGCEHVDSADTAVVRIYNDINMARYIESDTIRRIVQTQFGSEQSIMSEIRDLIDVLEGLATGQSAVTNPKVTNLGPLISGIFDRLIKFESNEYYLYPTTRQSAVAIRNAKKDLEYYNPTDLLTLVSDPGNATVFGLSTRGDTAPQPVS